MANPQGGVLGLRDESATIKKPFYECRLPNPRFTSYEYDLSLAAKGSIKPAVKFCEFVITTDKASCRLPVARYQLRPERRRGGWTDN
jgi:hypothetical protein